MQSWTIISGIQASLFLEVKDLRNLEAFVSSAIEMPFEPYDAEEKFLYDFMIYQLRFCFLKGLILQPDRIEETYELMLELKASLNSIFEDDIDVRQTMAYFEEVSKTVSAKYTEHCRTAQY